MGKKKTDFKAIISEIHSNGMSDQWIGNATEIERSKITRVRLGNHKKLDYDDGVAIIELYKRVKERK